MVLSAHDPAYLRQLIEEAREETHKHLDTMPTQVEKMVSPFWDGAGRSISSSGGETFAPENTYFEYMTAMVPRLVYNNPRVRVTTRRTGPQERVAESMRHGLNRQVRDLRLNMVLRDLAEDMLFSWGVAIVKEVPRRGVVLPDYHPVHPAIPTWPIVQRVPQRKAFWDPDSYDWDSPRFRGHEWRVDKDDLLKRARENPEEGWVIRETEKLATDPGDGTPQPGGQRAERKHIRAYDVWFPEIELPESPGAREGFHGTIFTIAFAQQNTTGVLYDADGERMSPRKNREGFIREPRPFYGPRTGPYTIFGCYKVPDSPYPLSPLVAVEGQILDLNDHAQAASRSMQRHKRFIGVHGGSQNVQKIKNALHDYVVPIPYESGRALVEQIELGGMTDQQLNYLAVTKERLDRTLGMDETMRGNVAGGATATEHTLANESSLARIGEIKEAFARGVTDLLTSMAHYLYYSDTSTFPLGDEVLEGVEAYAPSQGMEAWFFGGNPDPESGHTFEDLELEIEPFSMGRTSEGLAMQRAMQAHELLTASLPMMREFPDFPWKEDFKKLGEAMNMPNMEELIPQAMLDRLAKQLEMMSQQQVQPQMAAPQGARMATQVRGSMPSLPSGGSRASQGGGPPTGARSQGQGMPGQQRPARGPQRVAG
jgi:hypothetical protein